MKHGKWIWIAAIAFGGIGLSVQSLSAQYVPGGKNPEQTIPQKVQSPMEQHQEGGMGGMASMSADDVKKLVPDFLTEQFDFAAYEPDSGYADATLTTNSFLESAKRNGATLIQNCEVTAIRTAGGKVIGVSTTQGDFDAAIIINAAGAWAKHVASLAGLEVRERSEQIRAALASLPANYRAVIELRHYQELSYDEIASMDGLVRSGGFAGEKPSPIGEGGLHGPARHANDFELEGERNAETAKCHKGDGCPDNHQFAMHICIVGF